MDNQPPKSRSLPPRQQNLQTAAERAVESLRPQAPDQLTWLGAKAAGDRWRVAVLGTEVEVDLATGRVSVPAAQEVKPQWRILVLHYLSIRSRPQRLAPEISFAELPARAYAGIYEMRTTGRLCATVGRNEPMLRQAAEALGGRIAEAGALAYDFQLFPRLDIRLIWHGGDEEFAPSATLLFPRNIEEFFVPEDIVVLSERFVSRLAGGPF